MKLKNLKAEEFYNNYSKNVAPIFEKYEGYRKLQLLKLVLITAVFIPVFIWGWKHAGDLVGHFYAITGIAYAFLIFSIISNFNKKIKNECMQKLLSVFGDIYWLGCDDSEKGMKLISNQRIYDSELFAGYNSRTDDDVFTGRYNNVEFSIVETGLIQRGNKSSRKIFDGVLIEFESNKDIKNKTIITTKGDMNTRRSKKYYVIFAIAMFLGQIFPCIPLLINKSSISKSWLSILLAHFVFALILVAVIVLIYMISSRCFKSKIKMNRVNLEDPVFNKKYDVFSSDEIESRYLITTAFMDRLKNLTTSFGSKDVKCCFYEGKILFAISTNKNLFEIGKIFRKLNNPKQINTFYKEISSIFNMIDYFKLGEKIGL